MPSQWIAILEVLFLVATGWQVLNWLGLGRAAWRKEPSAQWADTGPGVSIVTNRENGPGSVSLPLVSSVMVH